MVTIAVLATLIAIGAPAMTDVIRNGRRTALINELLASVMLARSEASRSGQAFVVCGFDDANDNGALDPAERTCTGLDWRDGWMVALWLDADSDGALDNGELAAPARIFVNDYANLRVTGSGSIAAPAVGAVGAVALMPFNREGTSGRLTVCDPRGATRARAVDITASGRPAMVANNVEDPGSGVALSCP